MGVKETSCQFEVAMAAHFMTLPFNYAQYLHWFKWILNTSVVPGESNKFSVYLCCSIFPSPEQNPGLSHYQGLLNTGGSLPDLSNLHFPSPLSTPLDPEDNGGYPNLSGGSSTGNLPAAMMHLGIGNSQGGWSTALCCVYVQSLPVCVHGSHPFWHVTLKTKQCLVATLYRLSYRSDCFVCFIIIRGDIHRSKVKEKYEKVA